VISIGDPWGAERAMLIWKNMPKTTVKTAANLGNI
jgi:hypothetical protein